MVYTFDCAISLRTTQSFILEALQGVVNKKPDLTDAKTGNFIAVPRVEDVPIYIMSGLHHRKHMRPEFLQFLDSDGNVEDRKGLECASIQKYIEELDDDCIECKKTNANV